MQSIIKPYLFSVFMFSSCLGSGSLRAPAPERPLIVLLLPARGSLAAESVRAGQGAQIALGDRFETLTIDPHDPGWRETLLSLDRAVGVLAWGGQESVAAALTVQAETDLPVILASTLPLPAQDGLESPPLPRILPNPDIHARCAAAMLPSGTVALVHDGSAEGLALNEELTRLLRRRVVANLVLDVGAMGTEAARVVKLNARTLVFSGLPANGGDLLYTAHRIRTDGAQEGISPHEPAFFGVGLYDARFLEQAGPNAEAAWATTVHRPLNDPTLGEVYSARFQEAPSPAAIDLHDAALLFRAAYAVSEGEGGARLAEEISHVMVDSAAGPLMVRDGQPQPAWCTAFQYEDGVFQPRILARVTDGEVEIIAGKENLPPPPRRSKAPYGKFLAPP